MRRVVRLIVVLGVVSALLPVGEVAFGRSLVDCPSVKPPKLSFGKPSFIDENRAGGEPVSIVAQDGSITVSAHAGTTHLYKDPNSAPGAGDFAVGYWNQTLNWRSTDGGKTWKYVGLAGQEAGPHSLTSTGFSDPDLTMDAGGRLYNVEIDLANVAVFSSPDDGQSWPFANPEASSGDRPWVTGAEENELFLYVNAPHQLLRSTDGGLTFLPVTTNFPVDSKLLVDPINPETGLIGPSGSGAAISNDDGQSWEAYPGVLGPTTSFFGAIGVDRAGWIYSAAAGGYGGTDDVKPDGQVTMNYFNRKTKQWQSQPIEIPIPKGDALWPWLMAGDDGRLAITWYQTLAKDPNKFYIYVAYTHNAHGTTVTCSDGSKRHVPPQFTVVNASKRPIHVGRICLSGTACNATLLTPDGGDRRLGDFFTINFDHKGNLFVVSGDTTLPNPMGGPKPVGNPIFIKQSAGEPILQKPDKVRKTRCLFPQPTC